MKKGDLFVLGIKKNSSDEKLSKAIEKIFLKASNNLSWLSKGDKVLLKPALNSPDKYPATTHPLALKVVSDILKERGAKVIVADQSGIEHVLHDKTGVIRGSSSNCFEKSGMDKSGVDFIAIEDYGWNAFYKPNCKTPSWKNGFYISKLVKEVDHIINLPRVSTHIQAGVTLGFKSLVGLIREDSRMEFHADGAFNSFIKSFAKDSKLRNVYDDKDLFFEKIVEIGLAVKNKLRLTLFVGTKTISTIGPDRKVSCFKSNIIKPETGLVFASSNPIATEVFGISFLTLLYSKTSFYKRLLQKLVICMNRKIKELGKEDVWENRFIRHGLKIGLGNKNFEIHYDGVPNKLRLRLKKLMRN